MGRPKPHKSLPIPQITEKTLTHRVKYGSEAEKPDPEKARKYRAGDLCFGKAMMRERIKHP